MTCVNQVHSMIALFLNYFEDMKISLLKLLFFLYLLFKIFGMK